MTTTTLSSHAQQRSGIFESLCASAIAFIEGIYEGREMARAYSRLSSMSSDELRKRGLTRADITRTVASGYTV